MKSGLDLLNLNGWNWAETEKETFENNEAPNVPFLERPAHFQPFVND